MSAIRRMADLNWKSPQVRKVPKAEVIPTRGVAKRGLRDA